MKKLGVIFGGMSTENKVSCVSGASVIKNLNKEKYEIFPIFIDENGKWFKIQMPQEGQIKIEDKEQIEEYLNQSIKNHLDALATDDYVMLKLTIPTKANLYQELADHSQVLRVVALSGGYETDEANEILSQNDNVIASFSRALTQDLSVNQSDADFDAKLKEAVDSIYEASVVKN